MSRCVQRVGVAASCVEFDHRPQIANRENTWSHVTFKDQIPDQINHVGQRVPTWPANTLDRQREALTGVHHLHWEVHLGKAHNYRLKFVVH